MSIYELLDPSTGSRTMNIHLLKKLIDLAEKAPDSDSLDDFLRWAYDHQQLGQAPTETPLADNKPSEARFLEEPEQQYYDSAVPVLQTYISHGITKAYRFFRVYVKRAFENQTPLSFDEFISLAFLALGKPMTKTELVEIAINEKTSGLLVINRLIDQGLIAQYSDPDDKRSRRLTITPAGLETLRAAQNAMNQATRLLTADLNTDEQKQLATLLKRMEQFHEPIYRAHLQNRELNLDELQGQSRRFTA